jgi:hypothetical protein
MPSPLSRRRFGQLAAGTRLLFARPIVGRGEPAGFRFIGLPLKIKGGSAKTM